MGNLNSSNFVNDPRWGAENRSAKAFSIIQTVKGMTDVLLPKIVCLDIGCGSGGISAHIAPYVKSITGVDPETWNCWNIYRETHGNLYFLKETVESLSCKSNSIDFVICNQVYEHVPDPTLLIDEVYRVLKPGGICYFAGPNLLFPIEPHVFWPFIHWMPRGMAIKIMKLFGSKNTLYLDSYSVNYWTLIKWLKMFEIKNALPYVLKNPKEFSRNRFIFSVLAYVPDSLINRLTFLTPGFIFILKKKG